MWTSEEFGGIELLRARLTDFAFRPHSHEEYFVALTDAGSATPTFRGKVRDVLRGDLIVLNPDEAHRGGPPAGGSWHYGAAYLRPAILSRLLAAEFPAPRSRAPEFGGDVVRDPAVASRFARFLALAARREGSLLERESRLTETLVLLAARHGSPHRAPRPVTSEGRAVELVREYLDEHAEENVRLGTLSVIADLSPFYLCRVFRSAVGMSPHDYLTNVRVRRAKAMLRAGVPIASAAAETGFYDQAHLSRSFKRIVGLPPARYRSGAAEQ